jgi:uncharacterized membrane protein YphA (DoxX/SURF4 family)
MLWLRTFLIELHDSEWLGIFAARLAIGLLFFLSGHAKLFLAERGASMLETLVNARVPFPVFQHIPRFNS